MWGILKYKTKCLLSAVCNAIFRLCLAICRKSKLEKQKQTNWDNFFLVYHLLEKVIQDSLKQTKTVIKCQFFAVPACFERTIRLNVMHCFKLRPETAVNPHKCKTPEQNNQKIKCCRHKQTYCHLGLYTKSICYIKNPFASKLVAISLNFPTFFPQILCINKSSSRVTRWHDITHFDLSYIPLHIINH